MPEACLLARPDKTDFCRGISWEEVDYIMNLKKRQNYINLKILPTIQALSLPIILNKEIFCVKIKNIYMYMYTVPCMCGPYISGV